jgi:hypothetical protein
MAQVKPEFQQQRMQFLVSELYSKQYYWSGTQKQSTTLEMLYLGAQSDTLSNLVSKYRCSEGCWGIYSYEILVIMYQTAKYHNSKRQNYER